jgi:hypothetical protein
VLSNDKKRFPRAIRLQLVGLTASDPRTVDRYLDTREPMRAPVEHAIRGALATLGIPDPRALNAGGRL